MIAGRNVLRDAAFRRDHKQVCPLEMRVSGPMPEEKPGENHGFHFGSSLLLVAGFVAGVVRTVRVDRGGEQYIFAVGRPERAICLSENVRNFSWTAGKLAAV